MRVFVLGTGRCGTTTFIRACRHLTNFTCGHESLADRIGRDRFHYADRHIEADNRLSWFLGQLGRQYPDALYVHLRRHREEVAASFMHRWHNRSVIRAFGHQIVMRDAAWSEAERLEVCRFYVDTVTANIEAFLAGRDRMTVWLHEAGQRFPAFLDRIGAEGDLAAAVAEWAVRHNATPPPAPAGVATPMPGPGPAPRPVPAPVCPPEVPAAPDASGRNWWRQRARALSAAIRSTRG